MTTQNRGPNPPITAPKSPSAPITRWRRWLAAHLDQRQVSEDMIIISTALVIGIGTGVAAVIFIWLLRQVAGWAFLAQLSLGLVLGTISFMALAGLAVGYMVERWVIEVKGGGIPEVMEAVAMRGGRIRPRVAPLKMLASAITIGAGGSAGREGPIVQVGAALGSTIGQLLHFSDERVRTLVACGSAAGIAATFNAPIAGTIFAMEVILGRFTVRYFGAVVISSVTAGVISQWALGDRPAFDVPTYTLNHPGELPIYVVLGILAAGVAVLFTRLLYAVSGWFDRWKVRLPLRASAGMVLTAILGLMLLDMGILGSGLDTIGRIIAADFDLPLSLMAAMLLYKLLATSFTLGSGNSGGVFAPLLFIGAALGGMVGTIANSLWPAIADHPGAYAIVGMAAVFSGAARAPITAVIIVFEMSGGYELIFPLMVATVLSTLLAQHLFGDSIYSLKLKLKGITLERGRDVDVMHSVMVGEVMSPDFTTVPRNMTIDELSDLFTETHSHGYPILNEQGSLCGIATITDLDRAVHDGLPPATTVMEIGVPRDHLAVTTPDESVGEALARMGTRGLGRLPVVDTQDPNRLLGVIRRSDIIRAYNMALSRRAELQHRAKRSQLQNIDGTIFTEIILSEGDRAAGKRLSELASSLPHECILVSIRRRGRMLIPHGDTVFQPGDRVTAFISTDDLEAIHSCLHGNAAENGK